MVNAMSKEDEKSLYECGMCEHDWKALSSNKAFHDMVFRSSVCTKCHAQLEETFKLTESHTTY